MRVLRHIRCSVSQDIANTIACSIVGNMLDYCNALLLNALAKTVSRLQRVQTNLARIVFDIGISKLHDSGRRTGDLLHKLDWLPVHSRIICKVALLCYKSYKLGSPTYLSSLLQQYTPSRSLRLSTENWPFLLGDNTSTERSARHRLSCSQCWFIPKSA